MNKILFLVLGLFLLETVYADILVTEVMYNPTEASDTDLEWIEIYNNGTNNVNLSEWKIDDSNFDDFVIFPGELVVISRELIDGIDLDNDSFENIYGNNDGLWDNLDGNYRAFDGDFSLTDNDKINLSFEIYNEILEYNTSFGGNGNGYSIERINYSLGNYFENWEQSKILGGKPGYGNVIKEGSNKVDVFVEVISTAPLISLKNISDDVQETGIQIIPSINDKKLIFLEISVNSTIGVNDIDNVKAELNGINFEFTNYINLDNFSRIYYGNVTMNYFDNSGGYIINVSSVNKFNKSSSFLANFQYLSLLAIDLDKTSINFGKIEAGKVSSGEKINIINYGNADVDLEIYGNDLESGINKINISSIEFGTNNFWRNIDYKPSLIDFNLVHQANSNKDLLFRLNLPLTSTPSVYAGTLNLVGLAK